MEKENNFDESKFEILDALILKGRLTTIADVGDIKVGFRTLNHEEELNAVSNANGQPLAFKVEQLSLAIISLNGKKISDDPRERDFLRKKLLKMPSLYINEYYTPYLQLIGKVPPITKENVEVPLDETTTYDQSTKSALTVESFQTTP